MESVRHGLRNLLVMRGRDSRADFWPFAGAVVGAWFVVGNGLFLGVMVWGVATRQSFELMYGLLFGVTFASGAVMVVLLAAAIARRLHDRDLRGGWALIPLGLLVSGAFLMGGNFLGSDGGREPNLMLFLVGFANNVAYLGCVAALVVVLALPSRPAPNRFDVTGQ